MIRIEIKKKWKKQKNLKKKKKEGDSPWRKLLQGFLLFTIAKKKEK